MALRLRKDQKYIDRRTKPAAECKTCRLAFRIPEKLAGFLDREAERRGWDRSTAARTILTEFFRPGTTEL